MNVEIINDFASAQIRLFIWDGAGDTRQSYFIGENGKWERETIAPFAPMPCALTLDRHMLRPLMEALRDFVDKQGLKTKDESRLEGELAATRYHLADMRKLTYMLTKGNKK